jgi:uncharacterized protein
MPGDFYPVIFHLPSYFYYFWDVINQPKMYERKLLKAVKEHLGKNEVSVITGARQTGKTTILEQLYRFLTANGEEAYLFTLEEPAFLSALNENPENLFRFTRLSKERIFVLLDEIQYLKNPSGFLKLLYDKYKDRIKIIATGSSAFYIDSRFKDSLAGRKRIFNLYPLDFDEFLTFKGFVNLIPEMEEIRTRDDYTSAQIAQLRSLFDEYLIYGGYPAVILTEKVYDKKEILRDLFMSYLRRDILEAGIQHQDKFYNLMLVLANQTGSLLNVSELANTLKLSVTAVENYIYVLRKCFHISLVRPFYSNIRKELTKMPKIYFNDTGFRNTIINQFSVMPGRMDRGLLSENYVFIRLAQLHGADAIRHWRTTDGNEVDFIIPETQEIGSAVEVKFDKSEFRLTKYRKFINLYPGFNLKCRAYKAESNSGLIMAL